MHDPSRLAKDELRRQMLRSRQALNAKERSAMDRRICGHLLRLMQTNDAIDVAGFVSFRGEPNLVPALEVLYEAGRRIWLPIVEGRHLYFGRWTPGTEMCANRYGIPEPDTDRTCPAQRLDVVLMPLVAFCCRGMRLGMGAGFYDRAFGFTRDSGNAPPRLVGVGYALQQVDTLPNAPWDVPLDAVATDQGIQTFAN